MWLGINLVISSHMPLAIPLFMNMAIHLTPICADPIDSRSYLQQILKQQINSIQVKLKKVEIRVLAQSFIANALSQLLYLMLSILSSKYLMGSFLQMKFLNHLMGKSRSPMNTMDYYMSLKMRALVTIYHIYLNFHIVFHNL